MDGLDALDSAVGAFRARLVGRERRKLYITGEARASQGLIATATATFISLLDEPAGAGG